MLADPLYHPSHLLAYSLPPPLARGQYQQHHTSSSCASVIFLQHRALLFVASNQRYQFTLLSEEYIVSAEALALLVSVASLALTEIPPEIPSAVASATGGFIGNSVCNFCAVNVNTDSALK